MNQSTMSNASQTCASQLKILADSTRLGVLKALQQGPQNVSALTVQLDIEQSLLSHHLRILREANFVVAERAGKSVFYRLAPQVHMERNGLNLNCCVLSF